MPVLLARLRPFAPWIAAALLFTASLGVWAWEDGLGGQRWLEWLADIGPADPDTFPSALWWWISDHGYAVVIAYACACLAVLLGDRRQLQTTLVALLAAAVVGSSLKGLVDRTRPSGTGGVSWPSGHTYTALSFALSLRGQPARRFWPVLAAALLVAASRLVRLRHWPADVLAGAAVACVAVGIAALLPTFLPRAVTSPRGRAVVAIAMLGALAAQLVFTSTTRAMDAVCAAPLVLACGLWLLRHTPPARSGATV